MESSKHDEPHKGINLHLKHIIFDYNGTLINDALAQYEPCAQAFREHELPFLSFDRFQKELYYPVKNFYIENGFDTEKYDFAEMMDEYHRRFLLLLEKCELFSDVKETLEFFKNKNVSLSILSSLEHNMLMKNTKDKGIDKFFTNITGTKDTQAGSKIDNAKKWFQESGFKNHEIIMVGDTLHDAEVAEALNITCFLVSRGVQHKDVLQKSKYRVFDSLKDMVEYIKTANYISFAS